MYSAALTRKQQGCEVAQGVKDGVLLGGKGRNQGRCVSG